MNVEKSERAIRKLSQSIRQLTDKDVDNLRKQNTRLVSPFQAGKLEENAKKYWDQFYNRNKTKFFKDRHWTTREFGELVGDLTANSAHDKPKLLEIGCGVGNLIFPLLEDGVHVDIFACDFSPRAVEYIKCHALYKTNNVHVFQNDVTTDDLLTSTGVKMDLVTMVFVLSAIHPDNFITVIENVYRVLNPGGLVLFRDYGIHDMTQIRFKPGHKISDNLYMRQDGTRSYFFSLGEMKSLFKKVGFEILTCDYVETRTVNKKEGIDEPRVFVQAKFKKPD